MVKQIDARQIEIARATIARAGIFGGTWLAVQLWGSLAINSALKAMGLRAFVGYIMIEENPWEISPIQWGGRASAAFTDATFNPSEENEHGSAAMAVDRNIGVDVSANSNGLDEALGFNTETGQHTVATPGLSGVHGTGVLGNFNIETQMYNNFGPGAPSANGPTPEGGTPGSGPGSAPGAGGQAP